MAISGKTGLVNDWAPRAQERMKLMEGLDPRHHLGITAANEHFTAIMADWMLANPDLLATTDEAVCAPVALAQRRGIRTQEHGVRPVQGAGRGMKEWRVGWFKRITTVFLVDTLRQTVNNLRRDGTLWKWSTWKSAASYLFGPRGLIRQTCKPWREYKRLISTRARLEAPCPSAGWPTTVSAIRQSAPERTGRPAPASRCRVARSRIPARRGPTATRRDASSAFQVLVDGLPRRGEHRAPGCS